MWEQGLDSKLRSRGEQRKAREWVENDPSLKRLTEILPELFREAEKVGAIWFTLRLIKGRRGRTFVVKYGS